MDFATSISHLCPSKDSGVGRIARVSQHKRTQTLTIMFLRLSASFVIYEASNATLVCFTRTTISPESRKDSQPPAVHVSAVLDVQSPNLFVRTDIRRHAVRQTGGREGGRKEGSVIACVLKRVHSVCLKRLARLVLHSFFEVSVIAHQQYYHPQSDMPTH